jgi:hypothetical protein
MKRSTLILAGILALLTLAAFLVLQRPGEQSISAGDGEMLVSYDSAAVDKIEVKSVSGTTVLQREGSGWMLTVPLRAQADDGSVRQLLSQGRTIAVKAMVSSNPQKQGVFQVDSTGTLVRISTGGEERAAFRIGKGGPSYTETYVRREGSDDVYLADGMLLHVFVRQPRDWRDKAILRLPQESIKTVRYSYGDTTFVLALHDSVWLIDGVPAADYVVRNLIGSLATFSTDDFVDTAVAAPPPLSAAIEVEGVQLRFHKKPRADAFFVITSQGPQVYEVQGWHAAQVLKRKNELTGSSS